MPYLALFVALFAVHAGSLGNGFHYDDEHSLLRNPHIRSLGELPAFFTQARTFSENPEYAMYRPVVLVAHALNYALGGYQPQGYHLLNLGIHCLATLLVYHLLRQLGFLAVPSLGGALLFGLHPAQTEPINYISSRSESLAGLFCLAAFSCYLRTAGSSLFWGVLSWGAFALALLSKSTALALPLVLLLHHFLLKPRSSLRAPNRMRFVGPSASESGVGKAPEGGVLAQKYADRGQRRATPLAAARRQKVILLAALKVHLPYWALSGLYLLLYGALAGQGLERASQVRDLSSQLATQAKALVHYLQLVFAPVHLNVCQQFFASSSFLEPHLYSPLPLLGWGAFASLAGVALAVRCRHPWAAFALGWFFLTLLPTLVVPLHILVNDHRLYLPLFGLALLAARWAADRTWRWPLWAVCALFTLLSFQRDRVWKDELTLWQDAAARAPLMPEAHYNLGHALHQLGDLEHARPAYERAVALSPGYTRALVNLGAIYREKSELGKAAQLFQQALEAEPGMVEALNDLGLVYAAQHHYEAAIALYHQALGRAPERAEVWLNLGLAYRDSGRGDEALSCLSRALQLDPSIKERFGP